MMRWLLVLPLMLFGLAATGRADGYLIIKYTIGKKAEPQPGEGEPGNMPPMGQFGVRGGPPIPGGPGGPTVPGSGSFVGIPKGPGGPGGPPIPGGPGGPTIPGSGSFVGIPKGPGGPGGPPIPGGPGGPTLPGSGGFVGIPKGPGGGFAGSPGMPMLPGGLGIAGGGPKTGPGGVPPLDDTGGGRPKMPGYPGYPGMPGFPGMPGMPGFGGEGSDAYQLTLTAVTEHGKILQLATSTQQILQFTTKWGKTMGYTDAAIEIRPVKAEPITKTLKTRWAELKKAINPEASLTLANDALDHGMVKLYEEIMDELAKGPAKGAKAFPDTVKSAVASYSKLKARLDTPPNNDQDLLKWQRAFPGYAQIRTPHYAVLYEEPSIPGPAARRAQLLEDNLRLYYYWFAKHGIELAMPTHRLVAVVADKEQTYLRILEDLGATGQDLHVDGYYAYRQNLLVFCAQRLDFLSRALANDLRGIYSMGISQEELLRGVQRNAKGAIVLTPDQKKFLQGDQIDTTLPQLARAETLALLDHVLTEQAEVAGVTHEGTRQLLVMTGVIPPSVFVPQWYERGIAAYFETPRGPFPGNPPDVQAPYWTTINGGRWAYLRPFQGWIRARKWL
jgi:hypothetical protein